MKKVELTMGHFSLVDDCDFEHINKFNWCVNKHGNGFRAVRTKCDHTELGIIKSGLMMHNFIMHPELGMVVDHIDGNSLNNQRNNLRICTRSENMRNRRKHQSNCSSEFKGVSRHKMRNGSYKWRSTVRMLRKRLFDGLFDNEIDAAIAYNVNAIKFYGKFACINQIPLDFT